MNLSNDVRTGPIQWGKVSVRYRGGRQWGPLDIVLVLILTLIAALTAFTDLGNRSAPQTFWKPDKVGESFTADFGELRTIDRLNLYEGPGAKGDTKIESSEDGQNWELYVKIEHKTNRVFTWKLEEKTVKARYMRFTTESTGYRLYEAAFFTKGVTVPVPVNNIQKGSEIGAASEGSGYEVFDEQQWAPYRPDYRNGMYFDEIYHGRTAYEFIQMMEPYENTHPPLGKVILAIGVKMFDMTPYGWRFMAGVFGTLMVPIFYWAARGMFERTRYAFIATLLLVLEGFHLVHSRMANVDIIGVTFTIIMFYAMHRYGEIAWRGGGFRRSFGYLALSGLFFGAAAAVKWNYLYGGAGLAGLLVFALARRWREARGNGDYDYGRRLVLTLMACLILFIAVPVGVYTASYAPYLKATKAEDSYKDLWQYQKNMYHYHKGVKEKHPYSSKWYTWPLMIRPVWYYGGKDLVKGDAQSIAAIGNPLIWWGGLLAMLASWWLGWRRRDRIVLTLAVAYLSFYVPWMIAPRSITFLYHYFPMVPLLILSIVWMLRWIEEHYRDGRRFTVWFVVAAAALFIWFYPIYTGITISREWMNLAIRWLPSWGF
ncbi:phospholipid carrier-dependent glycosyltransferase [Cohnella silvisoli]|uniref:Polyprenol-phosphate-mannose--protein mannosyltransferase n=1 Tax=Cohnella silvisoli TaxID=2873699 RepID=A0ABV1L331_9BACL|nr:glycosyltransferase family 39 protein [Cohnella silvisoli]MCD9025986.1 glycosyltransferase family 39 protein [Cohnella silvisoli]